MWTDTYIMWSPEGSYLATFHRQGIALWGGDDFGRLHRFNHTNVQLIDFSPGEKYVVTYSPVQDNAQDPSVSDCTGFLVSFGPTDILDLSHT